MFRTGGTAEVEFLRSLPLDPEAARPKLRYLKTLITRHERPNERDYRDYVSGIFLINSAGRV